MRVALRDLGRYQARSAAALAAISLSIAIAVAVVVAATAAVNAAGEGNMSDRQLLMGTGPPDTVRERTPAQTLALQTQVERFAETLDGARVVGLDVAVDPANRESMKGVAVWPVVTLGARVGPSTLRFVDVPYVATPELLAHLGLAGHPIDPATDVLTPRTGDLTFVNGPGSRLPKPVIEPVDLPAYSEAPASLITPAAVARAGWQVQRTAWLVESASPLTNEQVRAARAMTAVVGLSVEVRDEQASLGTIRNGATAAGALLALGVLAMTVGLIRSEAAGDLRTLTAAGATSTVRRAITATTAGSLGFLGVAVGTATAYAALLSGYSGRLEDLGRVPVGHLAITLVGVPVVAMVAGWLLAGKEPPAMARPAFE